jgi:hypothetical protein
VSNNSSYALHPETSTPLFPYGGKSLDCEADMGDVEKGIHDILSRAATKAATEALWRDQQPPEFQPKRCG